LDLTGWSLSAVNAISPDGRSLAGNGYHNGIFEAWMARLPVAPSDR
jgi:hypothetical protein